MGTGGTTDAGGAAGTGVTTTTSTGGGSGVGGGCVQSVGLENGDFTFWATSDPDHWLQQKYNCMVAASTLPSQTDGLSIGLTTVGANAYGGFYQTQSFLDWTGCVRLSGDAMKSTGTGRYRAIAEFNGEQLEITLPGGGSFAEASATCQPSGPIDVFTVRLRVDQVPEGGTVTYRMHEVRFDEVCCTGSEPACAPL